MYILCLLLASCLGCYVHVVLLFQVVVVESQNVPDVLVMAGKRKQRYEYLSIRQEIEETKLREKNVENAILQRSLEEHKRSVEALTERFRTTKVSEDQVG